ncbi:DUF3450 family protein [Paraglaciecola aquimarina]|uniref:DUF3450 family protein n=1 Tax=Paraglaciecola aquimarina TaxID=1235557 RepID=A0ABU3T0A2_9ALTE|nr:DUF3450 family protein [Paraglaciecola aquimarina]MDU0355670.1 DUF3450 family protein [Paraglaciecola aquimarina]
MQKLLVILWAFSGALNAAEQVDDLDKLVAQWTQLEQQQQQLSQRWQESKIQQDQLLILLKQERQQLQTTIGQHTAQRDEVINKRAELLQQQTQLEQVQQNMQSELAKVSDVLLGMYQQLPPLLKHQWQGDIDALTGDHVSLLTTSEQLDKILLLLKSLESFEQRIALHQTTMQLANSENSSVQRAVEIQVDQVYLGLSQGWYLSKSGEYWGIGTTTPQGWQWQHQSSKLDVEALRSTITMLNDPATAQWVSLPINIGSSQ